MVLRAPELKKQNREEVWVKIEKAIDSYLKMYYNGEPVAITPVVAGWESFKDQIIKEYTEAGRLVNYRPRIGPRTPSCLLFEVARKENEND